MGVITGYPADTTTTDSDNFLTVDSGGSTKLTPASNLKTYLGMLAGSPGLSDAGITTAVIRSEIGFDFVVPNTGVWSADSAGSSRNGSMTAATLYIGGKRVTVAAITAHTFTASKDTYVDIDNSGGVTYTEVANNAASPTLAANRIRLAIVVTGASSIAAAASINQGQLDRVLPIASSNAYTFTDSLGNIICPRDPNRRLLGYRQIISSFLTTGGTTPTNVPGLSSPVLVPLGSNACVEAGVRDMSSTGTQYMHFGVYDGTTLIGDDQVYAGSASQGGPGHPQANVTPSTSSKTYNAGTFASTGNFSLECASANPAYIKITRE